MKKRKNRLKITEKEAMKFAKAVNNSAKVINTKKIEEHKMKKGDDQGLDFLE